MEQAKAAITEIITRLRKEGVSKTVIEIDLLHHIKRELAKEETE